MSRDSSIQHDLRLQSGFPAPPSVLSNSDQGQGHAGRFRHLVLCFAFLLSACSGSSTGPTPDHIVNGVNLTQLFAPPRPGELDSVSALWLGRDVSVHDLRKFPGIPRSVGGHPLEIRIVSHTVDGIRHYGAIITPGDAVRGSLPIIVYCHESDQGVNLSVLLSFLPQDLVNVVGDFVFVVPSFRSEPLSLGGSAYFSDGPPSPWDHDVDDALALLNVAIDGTSAADTTHIGVLGFSRGATVGMLMAERDPRIDAVVEFSGITDFLGTFAQQMTEEASQGHPRDLPSLDYLDTTLIEPLKNHELTVNDVRSELIRRSPIYFADRLPALQIHHGSADATIPVDEASALITMMHDLGRTQPEFEYYIYSGGTHDPSSLTGSFPRTVAFLLRLRPPALVQHEEPFIVVPRVRAPFMVSEAEPHTPFP